MDSVEKGEVDSRIWPLILLGAVFAIALVTANILSSKQFSTKLWFLTLVGPAGVVAYSVTFIATDVVSEVYGRKAAQMIVKAGFVAQIVAVVLAEFAVRLPTADFSPVPEEQYNMIVRASYNIIIASLIAYIISQYHDVWAFHMWRRLTGGRMLWLRNNLSTGVSQLIDTVMFITLAFYILPKFLPQLSGGFEPFALTTILAMIYSQYLIKLLIAAIDTPIVYLAVHLVNAHIKGELSMPTIARLGFLKR